MPFIQFLISDSVTTGSFDILSLLIQIICYCNHNNFQLMIYTNV